MENAAGNHLAPTSNRPEPAVKNFAYPIPVAVLSPPSARQSTEIPNDPSLYLTTTLSANLPPNPRSSRIEPLKADIFPAPDDPVPFIGGNADARQRPESTAYVPRTAGKQPKQTATPIATKRQTIHMIPQHADEQPFESLPFLTLAPLSPLQNTFFNDGPGGPQDTVVNSPGLSALSPGARNSIATDSTFANYMTAPTSPAAPPINSVNSIAAPAPPADVTSRLEKRKSWHPRNLMASMKPTKSETNDRRQTGFQTTSVMVEAARQGQAKEVKIKHRPKSTAFENLSVGTFSVPDRPGTGDVPPMPALDLSNTKDSKVVKQGKETPVKESIWNRRSRRKTIGAAEAERPKDVATSMPTMDKLRWKQLAMREKALADSKRAKGDRTTSPKPPRQQTGKPNLDLPTTVPAVYEPKKRVTRPLEVLPPPTTSTQTSSQRDPSLPTRYIPQEPIKPQERPRSPVEVRPITSSKGEDYPERSISRYNESPSTTVSPFALSLGVPSLPRGVHLLDDTPTSADGPAGTDPFPEDFDRDARGCDPTAHAAEAKAETGERPKHQRDPSKPKLLLGPFPPSRPASPSSSPPKKPLPQPPRFAPVQRKSYKLQSPTENAPAEQLTPWDQPMPLDIPDSLEYTRSASPTHEQRQPKHAREVSITKVVSAPRMVSSPAITPTLEISSPREIAQWEILPPREAPAPRDIMYSSREQKSPGTPQSSDLRPQDKTSFNTTRPQLDLKRSQPILNKYGEPPLRPRASSTDVKPSFDHVKVPTSLANLNALRPKTSGGLQTTPVYTIEVRDNEISEMTPASVKLLREQQSLLRRRALAAAGHSDPDAVLRRSPTPLAELHDRARGTTRIPAAANKAIGRTPAPLAGPGSARNPHPSRLFVDSSPRVSLDRQGRIQTHLGSGAAERKPVRSPLDSRPTPFQSSPRKKSIHTLPSPSTLHSAATSVSIPGTLPVVPHVSGSQMAEEMKVEREREINANRARYGLPARSNFSIPFVGDKLAAKGSRSGLAGSGFERTDMERGSRRRGKDKWWKIWRVV